MLLLHYQLLILGICLMILCSITKGEHIRVCPGKDLQIRCNSDEVIVPTSARLGRMEFNDCILVNEFIGCENDVLLLIDRWCSGKQECEVNVPNSELDKANKNCLLYLRKYLEIEYSCMKVTVINHLSCGTPVRLSEQQGAISSHFKSDANCGSASSPLVLSGMAGQTVTLNIIDFGNEKLKMENTSGMLPLYGYIEDGGERIAFYGGNERERFLYKSKSNEIAIDIEVNEQLAGFLLLYQKKGCPDLTPPAHAWYKRDGDQAVIGCEWSQKTWHLSCDGHSWSGVVGNCSEPATQEPIHIKKDIRSPSMLWLVCALSAAVVLMVIACVVGIVCIQKYRIKQDVQKSITLQRVLGQGHYDLDPNIEMASMLYLPYKISEQQQQQQQGTLSDPHRPTSYLIPQDQVVNELTPIRIWERPLPDLPDKPLATDTTSSYPINKPGRTPGDGDEAVSNANLRESDTLRSYQTDVSTGPSQNGLQYSPLVTPNV